jgi:hypothetical protein
MKFLKPTLTLVCGLSLTILVLPLLAPKAVHAMVATLVQVTNTSANPVINRDVDSPGRSPYYQTVTCYSSNSNQCTAQFSVVPANKRLVVEYIASSVDTPTALTIAEFDAAGSIFIPILHTLQGNDPAGNKIYVASQPMLYFFEAGQAPYYVMNAQAGGFEFMSGSITLTGYLVDLTQ